MEAGVWDSRFIIERREICAANRSVLVEQQPRTKHRAVVVQFRRMFQVTNGFVQTIFLPEMERRVEPGGGIVWIQVLRQIEFLFRCPGIGKFAGRLTEIITKQSTLWLQGGRRLEGSARFGDLALAEQAEPPAEPCRAERAVEFARAVERGLGVTNIVLVEQNEPSQSVGRRESRE